MDREFSFVSDITVEFGNINRLATVLWYSGCRLCCTNCQNPELRTKQPGLAMDVVFEMLTMRRKMTDWLVFLGGNPLDSLESVFQISEYAKELEFQQFMYTGYSLEQINSKFSPDTLARLSTTFSYLKVGDYRPDMDRGCFDDAKDFFFASVNQSVYKSVSESCWELFYHYDKNNKIEFSI